MHHFRASSLVLLSSALTYTCAFAIDSAQELLAAQRDGCHGAGRHQGLSGPLTVTGKDDPCPDCNKGCVYPPPTATGVPYYNRVKSKSGSVYVVSNVTGLVMDGGSRECLGGQVFGKPGPQANDWNSILYQCLSWCDNTADCYSLNFFSFQECDYECCETTVQCRGGRRTFNKTDYYEYDPIFPSYVFESLKAP